MDPEAFRHDLERKPAMLRELADGLEQGLLDRVPVDASNVVLIGMGSSRYAAVPAAIRLRAAGRTAVAEYASLAYASPPSPGTLAVGISATGATTETVEALRRHAGKSRTVALTNAPDTPLSAVADVTVPLLAGSEDGGVACRSFTHTVAVLLGIVAGAEDTARTCRLAAEACDDLVDRHDRWLPAVAEVLGDGPTFWLAPAERISSAEQSALMLREGPRRQADACESGDWLHVDVYLTKPLDYRAVLFAGSRFEPAIVDWVRRRGSRFVAVGGEVADAAVTVRYLHDDDSGVALLAEVLVAELVAARWWSAATA